MKIIIRGFSLALVVAASSFVLGGCYKPEIASGGLFCADAGNKCPEGFACNLADRRCYKPDGNVAVLDAPRDVRADAMCPAPLCAEGPGAFECNPTCQTGCKPCERCTVSGAAPKCVPVGTKAVGQVCNPQFGMDDCEAGAICLKESCGTNLGRCFRHCTRGADAPCNGSRCQIPIVWNGKETEFLTCDLLPQTCDPVGQVGCPSAGLTCFLTNANDQTICDCLPSGPGLPKKLGEACLQFNECAAGLVCVGGLGGVASSRCAQICRQSGGATCPVTAPRCVPIGGQYGYCGL